MSDEHQYKFKVEMACTGCSRALENVLNRFKSQNPDTVKLVDVDFDNKSVMVVTKDGAFSDHDVIRTVAKPGKKIVSGEKDGNEQWDSEKIEELLKQQ